MDDHSQKWHDGTTSRNIESNSSNDGLAALVNKLENLGRDMKKLKESVHAIQVGCQICEGPHLDKDCPLSEEVKQFEEVRYGEFGRTTPFNGNNGGKNQSASFKNLEIQIEQLTKEIHSDKTLSSSSEQIKTVTSDHETFRLNKLHEVSFISGPESNTPEVLQHQLPRKELNPGNFILPCMIGKFSFYAMANLGASINVMPRSIFEHLHLNNLKKTNVLCEMANMSKKAPLGIVENVLVKIDKLLFPSDFAIIDNTPSETTILGRPFLATIYAEIYVFVGKFSLGINEDIISFDSMRKDNNPSKKFMVNYGLINRPQSPAQSNNQIDYEESGNWDNRSPNLDDRKPKKRKINLDDNVPRTHFCKPIKQNIQEQTKMWPSCDLDKKMAGKILLSQTSALVWDNRYAEWCDISPSSEVSSQESNKPRPRDYTFREWTLIKVGHTDISEPVKKALLKLWLIDYFQDDSAIVNNPTHSEPVKKALLKLWLIDYFQDDSDIVNNPTHGSFDDYKWEFNLEIDKLADEYKLGIGKK
ncbi:reverse transcriptase domain-containing protein [Tanacetum coccineum]